MSNRTSIRKSSNWRVLKSWASPHLALPIPYLTLSNPATPTQINLAGAEVIVISSHLITSPIILSLAAAHPHPNVFKSSSFDEIWSKRHKINLTCTREHLLKAKAQYG